MPARQWLFFHLLGVAVLDPYGLVVNMVRSDFSKLLGVYVAVFAAFSVLAGQFIPKINGLVRRISATRQRIGRTPPGPGRTCRCSLREAGERCGIPSYLIENPKDIDLRWFADEHAVGITAGASAPAVLVQSIVQFLKKKGAKEIEEIIVTAENVVFQLPKGLLIHQEE